MSGPFSFSFLHGHFTLGQLDFPSRKIELFFLFFPRLEKTALFFPFLQILEKRRAFSADSRAHLFFERKEPCASRLEENH